MSNVVADGKVVILNYTLKNAQGLVLDESTHDDPFPYLHGADNIVPGLERALTGRSVGEKLEVKVEPKDGYGEREGVPQAVPRSAFPPDAPVMEGMQFFASDGQGNHMPIWVVGVQGDEVLVDGNHPLAGEVLHFSVEILGVRDATREEMAHGHPHGVTGHEGHDH
ncbi:MAG: peptidylprolyl isomerase [Myxococcales bacterium]|jgi:FKBP-type peptidyl-prolyl cis-trans isomerase SlyD|nr:peptidylprolyl isomerase [Myxococcales bacterium]